MIFKNIFNIINKFDFNIEIIINNFSKYLLLFF